MTLNYALVGEPIATSPSPAMHNAAFRTLDLDAYYSLRPAQPHHAESVIDELVRGAYAGVNVTTPMKTVLAPYADKQGDAARAGAVNTLWLEEGRLVGLLTDVDGVAEPLQARGVHGGEALIIGAGGATRAAVLGLERLDVRAHVAARRPEEAARLLRELDHPGEAIALDDARALEALLPRLNTVIQATPVGKSNDRHALPWERAPRHLVAFEMLYHPRRTPFLSDAARAGATIIEGWEMLLAQGAHAFARWTGKEAPRTAMRDALLRELSARS